MCFVLFLLKPILFAIEIVLKARVKTGPPPPESDPYGSPGSTCHLFVPDARALCSIVDRMPRLCTIPPFCSPAFIHVRFANFPKLAFASIFVAAVSLF
jgi:hypothetical protein